MGARWASGTDLLLLGTKREVGMHQKRRQPHMPLLFAGLRADLESPLPSPPPPDVKCFHSGRPAAVPSAKMFPPN